MLSYAVYQGQKLKVLRGAYLADSGRALWLYVGKGARGDLQGLGPTSDSGCMCDPRQLTQI